jgi:hypothetical protein
MHMVENIMFRYRFQERGFPEMDDLSVARHPERHWTAEIQEPLDVTAPASTEPLCCYIRTVIFYGSESAKVDECETRLQINDVIRDGDELWQVYSGSVAWTKGKWHMVWRLHLYDESKRRIA